MDNIIYESQYLKMENMFLFFSFPLLSLLFFLSLPIASSLFSLSARVAQHRSTHGGASRCGGAAGGGERERSDGVLPPHCHSSTRALVPFSVYGQPNSAGSDDNGEQLSSCIFFKIPFFLLFADVCVLVIWAMWLISFLLSICLIGIKYCGWAAGGAFLLLMFTKP
jgi:hypothetical protein